MTTYQQTDENMASAGELEKLFKSLPHYNISSKADARFYARLKIAAHDSEYLTEKRSWFSWGQFALAGSLASFIFIVSGTVWAYSDAVTRGHFMYPWKQTAERIELATAMGEYAEFTTHLTFSDRRLEEANNLLGGSSQTAFFVNTAYAETPTKQFNAKKTVYLAMTLEDMRASIIAAAQIVEKGKLQADKVESALDELAQATTKHVSKLAALQQKADEPAAELVQTVVTAETDSNKRATQARIRVTQARAAREEIRDLQLVPSPARQEEKLQRAKREFDAIHEVMLTLPQNKQDGLKDVIKAARQALDEGKAEAGAGLSKAVEKRMIIIEPSAQTRIQLIPNNEETNADLPTEDINNQSEIKKNGDVLILPKSDASPTLPTPTFPLPASPPTTPEPPSTKPVQILPSVNEVEPSPAVPPATFTPPPSGPVQILPAQGATPSSGNKSVRIIK